MNFANLFPRTTNADLTKRNNCENPMPQELIMQLGSMYNKSLKIARFGNHELSEQICKEHNEIASEYGVLQLRLTIYASGDFNEDGTAIRSYKVIQDHKNLEKGEMYLYGDTYEYRELIKSKGGKWLTFEKRWVVKSEVFEELFQICNQPQKKG